MEERLTLDDLHTDTFMIRRDLRYLIGAKVVGTVKLNCGPGTTQPNNCRFMSGPGNNPTKKQRLGFLAGSETE